MTSEQATAPIVVFAVTPMLELYGRAALALGTRPRWKFAVHEGDRRRFGDRTPGAATLASIQGGKDQQCP
jgi:hypothetical protein